MDNQLQQQIDSVRKGDIDAFEQLYHQYSSSVYSLAYSILKQPQDAQDAVQQTFLNVYLHLYQLDDPQMFELWLKRIAVNECRMLMRKRRPEISLDTVSEKEIAADFDQELMLPQTVAEKENLISRVREVIEALPQLQREALTLQLYHHMTVEQIAYVTSANKNTVKSRLYRARQKIKTSLAEYIEGFDGVALVPFGTVFLAVMQKDTKQKKPKDGWKQLRKLIGKDDGGIDGRIAALLPTERTGKGLAVKLAVALMIGAVLSGSFAAAVGDRQGDSFGGHQIASIKEQPATEPPTVPATDGDKPDLLPAAVQSDRQKPAPQEAERSLPQQTGDAEDEQDEQITPPTSAPTESPTRAIETTAPTVPAATEASTVPPTERPSLPYDAAFSAYLSTLQKARRDLDAYDKYHGGSTRQVAVTSLYGDDTPELLYLTRPLGYGYNMLNISTYQDGKIKTLNETYDIPSDSGFCFFIADGELYSCITYQTNGRQEYRYFRYVDSAGLDYQYNALQDVLVMHCNYNDGYHYSVSDRGEVTAEDFVTAEEELLARADSVVFVGNAERLPAVLSNFVAERSPSAMTLDEAKTYLTR